MLLHVWYCAPGVGSRNMFVGFFKAALCGSEGAIALVDTTQESLVADSGGTAQCSRQSLFCRGVLALIGMCVRQGEIEMTGSERVWMSMCGLKPTFKSHQGFLLPPLLDQSPSIQPVPARLMPQVTPFVRLRLPQRHQGFLQRLARQQFFNLLETLKEYILVSWWVLQVYLLFSQQISQRYLQALGEETKGWQRGRHLTTLHRREVAFGEVLSCQILLGHVPRGAGGTQARSQGLWLRHCMVIGCETHRAGGLPFRRSVGSPSFLPDLWCGRNTLDISRCFT